jgi:hypothetical protein
MARLQDLALLDKAGSNCQGQKLPTYYARAEITPQKSFLTWASVISILEA